MSCKNESPCILCSNDVTWFLKACAQFLGRNIRISVLFLTRQRRRKSSFILCLNIHIKFNTYSRIVNLKHNIRHLKQCYNTLLMFVNVIKAFTLQLHGNIS